MCEDWILAFAEVPLWSPVTPDTVVGFTVPGRWYRVQRVVGGFALVAPENNPNAPAFLDIRGDPVGIEGVQICR